MNRHGVFMAALGGLIVAIVASVSYYIAAFLIGASQALTEVLAIAASCFFIFFATFWVMPYWDTSGSGGRKAKPSH